MVDLERLKRFPHVYFDYLFLKTLHPSEELCEHVAFKLENLHVRVSEEVLKDEHRLIQSYIDRLQPNPYVVFYGLFILAQNRIELSSEIWERTLERLYSIYDITNLEQHKITHVVLLYLFEELDDKKSEKLLLHYLKIDLEEFEETKRAFSDKR